MSGRHQADVEANWNLVWSAMARGTSPSHQATGPTEREDDHGSSPWAVTVKWLHLPSSATGELGRRRSWPVCMVVCRARGGLLT